MTLLVSLVQTYMKHALGGGDPADLTTLRVLNDAGYWLTSFHGWSFMQRKSVAVASRAAITFSNATWTAATKTLTSTGAFTNYTYLTGDKIDIQSGTGVTTLGENFIVSRTSADAIVLATSIAVGDLVTGNIVADTEFGIAALALPTDFVEFLSVPKLKPQTAGGFELTDWDRLEALRTNSPATGGLSYWGVLGWAAPTTVGRPVPRLELFPSPPSNVNDQFRISYRATWTELTGTSDQVPIPAYCDQVYLSVCRAYIQGLEEDDLAGVSERLAVVAESPEMVAAQRADGMGQRFYGVPRGGHVQSAGGGSSVPLWTNGMTLGGPV